jgi:hypothetical protein
VSGNALHIDDRGDDNDRAAAGHQRQSLLNREDTSCNSSKTLRGTEFEILASISSTLSPLKS